MSVYNNVATLMVKSKIWNKQKILNVTPNINELQDFVVLLVRCLI